MAKDKSSKKVESGKRDADLDALLGELNKTFGEGAVFSGSSEVVARESVSTGSISLDHCIGIGGLPTGRIVEIFGAESSGKTTLALHVIASAQKKGKRCAFIDAEHALDLQYAMKLGINANDLLISQPNSGEQALGIYEMLVSSGKVDVIVVDSVAALTPQSEIDGDMGDSSVGVHARLMSKFCRKIAAITNEKNVLCIMINQVRMKIGVMFGSPEVTTGGNALKFYASVRLKVWPGEKVKKGDAVIGNLMGVRVVKNKIAPPFKECVIPIIYGKGIDSVGEVYTLAKSLGILDVAGATHKLDGEKIANGKDNMIAMLRSDSKLCGSLKDRVLAELQARKDGGEITIGEDEKEVETLDEEPGEVA